jgi:hypothetical protein
MLGMLTSHFAQRRKGYLYHGGLLSDERAYLACYVELKRFVHAAEPKLED